MKYQLIFFDVDGTLKSEKTGEIIPSTIQSIRKLKEMNIKVVAATGRPYSMCNELLNLNIDTFITANGAYTKHQNEVIYKIRIEQSIVKQMYDFSREHNHVLTFFTEELYFNGIHTSKFLPILNETLGLDTYPLFNSAIVLEEVYLMCLYVNDEQLQPYINRFPELKFERWHENIVNVLQVSSSKSLAAKQVLNYFNIDPKQTIAFGDGTNDIDLFGYTGLAVAMGNGNDAVKKAADFVTEKSSEDGIRYALETIGLL